ncbi:MAG: NAD(+)/NADH kinase [Oscillospiraceae bacterium]|jgi:NAD+ kinase|nr:NAD(+)/NADH kinase [Oscillospiraceae bacterium]
MRIVLSPNPYRDKGLKVVQNAERILRQAGAETCMCFPFELERENVEVPSHLRFLPEEEAFQGAELLVCFGGDGTILHAAKDAQRHGVPVLGVNLGSVGFMAELESDQLSLLEKLVQGKYRTEERMMLDVAVRREGRTIFRDLALNDAVITKGAVARIIDLEVKADGVSVGRFAGDGVIVSTPTGSTAYAMSAGGPIMEPTVENILVTPICPHALHARSFVLDGRRSVAVRMGRQSRKTAYLSVDGGRAFHLGGGDQVELHRSKSRARLVRLTNRSFYTVVNQKLGGHDR